MPNLGCRGAESPGWFDVLPKNCTRHDAWAGMLSGHIVVRKLPVAHSCGLLSHQNNVCLMQKCSSWMQNLMQIHCSTRSVILKVTATQYTHSLNGLYRPHWLVQWSHPCSRMRIPVHSPWLPGYICMIQVTLIILTTTCLFPDRPHVCSTCRLTFSLSIWGKECTKFK